MNSAMQVKKPDNSDYPYFGNDYRKLSEIYKKLAEVAAEFAETEDTRQMFGMDNEERQKELYHEIRRLNEELDATQKIIMEKEGGFF